MENSGGQHKENQSSRNRKKKRQRKKWERNERSKKKRRSKKEGKQVKRVVKEWKIWNEEKKVARSKEEAEKWVSEKFHWWIKIFGKKQSKRMPTRKIWDHIIELKEEFALRKGKVYPLSREEREEVREFIWKQLIKGYIRLSKSPQTALVFFVGKKDRKKQMVQDYWYLNEWMIKNNYPLPLISDVLENIDMKKVFTKMNLWWRYNNIRLKERDE